MQEKGGENIDIVQLAKTFWRGRRTIIKCVLIFFLIGLLVAIVSRKEYTATVTIVPQLSDNNANLGALTGLAAMAGINTNIAGSTEISPLIYPQIVSSIPFQLELMDTPLSFDKIDHTVTLYEYLTEYAEPSPLRKYTIGLPGVIIKAIKGKPEASSTQISSKESSQSLIKLAEEQKMVCNFLKNQLSLDLNSKDGYVKLLCRMPEALPSAQLVQRAQELLQQQITEFKIQKATVNLEFIQKQSDELREQYSQAQEALARFSDRNKNITTAVAQAEQERLVNDRSLAFSIYSEMAKQLEQAKIRVKEDTPIFTIIQPASVPLEKSKPNRMMILFTWCFLGGGIGVGIVFIKSKLLMINQE